MELTLPRHLAEIAEQIAEHARREGLDFYPTIFEMLTSEQMAQVAAYGGFPSALSALAVRDGVRAAAQAAQVRVVQAFMKWSSTTTRAMPIC